MKMGNASLKLRVGVCGWWWWWGRRLVRHGLDEGYKLPTAASSTANAAPASHIWAYLQTIITLEL